MTDSNGNDNENFQDKDMLTNLIETQSRFSTLLENMVESSDEERKEQHRREDEQLRREDEYRKKQEKEWKEQRRREDEYRNNQEKEWEEQRRREDEYRNTQEENRCADKKELQKKERWRHLIQTTVIIVLLGSIVVWAFKYMS